MGLLALGQLRPRVLIEQLLQCSSRELGAHPFGTLVLVVAAPAESPDGFLETVERSIQFEPPVSLTSGNVLHTAEFPTVPVPGSESVEADQIELLAELADAPHAVLPLRAPEGSRLLTIGRSPTSDIPLPDPSVSTQHAALFLDGLSVQLRDEGSKNGTTLNGRLLEPGKLRWLQPMDRVTFGRVRAFVCDPAALRAVLRSDARTLF